MQSMFDQSLPPDDFVLVCDGPLSQELDEVIGCYSSKYSNILQVVRLAEHRGLPGALNAGLAQCRCEWVFRMDSDDIAFPERCAKQLEFAQEYRLDVSSAYVDEFSGSTSTITGRRAVPRTHEEIARYIRWRNPFNHPCVLYKQSVVKAVGGYRDMPDFEDYDLWARLFLSGARMGNLQQPLVYMRAGENQARRRGGVRYCRNMIAFWNEMRRLGLVTGAQCIRNKVTRLVVGLLPNGLRAMLYNTALRCRAQKTDARSHCAKRGCA